MIRRILLTTPLVLGLVACSGSEDDDHDHMHHEMEAFTLSFGAMAGGNAVDCTSEITGMGPGGATSVGISDVRFYVSGVRLLDADGAELEMTLDTNDFQYTSDAGSVALIDLTGNSAGTCADSAIAFAEGTARTNDRLTGMVHGDIAAVELDIGLPQAIMKDVIATNSAEDAPSPLGELYWSWASGYRHLVFNFTVQTGTTAGEGYVHVGSRDCGGDGARALTDRESCGFVNNPRVSLSSFDAANDKVMIDLGALLDGVDFVTAVRDPNPPHDVVGMGPGVACHSSPMQDDCMSIFTNLGLDMSTGDSTGTNAVFSAR